MMLFVDAGLIETRVRELVEKSKALEQAILHSSSFSVIATDECGTIQLFNTGAELMLGYAASDIVNRITPADISDPEELSDRAAALSKDLNAVIAPGFEAFAFKAARGIKDIYELTYIRKDGSRFPAIVSVTALRTDHGPIIGYLIIAADNSAQRLVEERRVGVEKRLRNDARDHSKLLEETVIEKIAELDRSEEMFSELVASIPVALAIRGSDQRTIQYVNAAWQKLTGLRAVHGDVLANVRQTIHPDDIGWITHDRRKTLDSQVNSEYRLVRPDKSVRWVHARTFPIANPSGDGSWSVEIVEDVTQRREAQHQLLHLARHDALTDLPNRTFLHESLKAAIARADEEHLIVSVLILDIDYFKNVNDTLGHAIGDALLREFAARLAKCVRPHDMVGRLGGDEFAVIVLTLEDPHSVVSVATRIQEALQSPLVLDGHDVSVTTSIGIASYPTDAGDLETLIRYADAAMYDAKAAGKNALRCYTSEINARTMERSNIVGELRMALGRDEFVLHYQPKIHIDSGKWTSVEALIRWNRPGHGLVMPAAFIPVLEEIGLIVPVGAWIIDMACRHIQKWKKAGLGRIPIAVNVSSRQVHEERFVSQVAETLQEHRIDPGLLEFEITESTLMAHGEATDAILRRLKGLGISVAIDDFGTGYSNLAYLKRFAVDTLKIDITFVRDVTTNPDAATIAVAIINLAHSLRLKVTAEGVETREQLEFLRVHGCDEVQGYYLSKPLPEDQILEKFQQVIGRAVEPVTASRNTTLNIVHG